MPAPLPPLTRAAEARLRKPLRRGMFRPVDAARRELGLLSVGGGEARLYWLIDLPTSTVADARFLAFGSRWSHPAADALCELARSRPVTDACALPLAAIDAALRDDPAVPALADTAPIAFLADLQAKALAALPAVRLLPKPVEKAVYQRKREADWTAADRVWLPLSYLRKVGKVDGILAKALAERLPAASHRIESLNDDLRIGVKLLGIDASAQATAAQFLTDAVRTVHPELVVEVLP